MSIMQLNILSIIMVHPKMGHNMTDKEILQEISDALRPVRKQAQCGCYRLDRFIETMHLGTNQLNSLEKAGQAFLEIESILKKAKFLKEFE